MKKLFLVLSLVCTIFVVHAESKNDPLNAVVKIFSASSEPDYLVPWRMKNPSAGTGSGVVIAGNKILTNAHNIADASFVQVTKQTGDKKYIAKVDRVNHECDLAILTVADKSFFADITPFEIADTPSVQNEIIVVGYPMGGEGISFTKGIISRIELTPYAHSGENLLACQVDAAINPGNSGGPAFFNGKIIGIAFQGIRQGEGLGYLIHSDVIKHFLNDIKDGEIDGFGLCGIKIRNLENEDFRKYLGLTEEQNGILVTKVVNSKAKNGLEDDDVILEIDGYKIANNGNIRVKANEPRYFTTIIKNKQIGEMVKFKVLRDGKILDVEMPVKKSDALVGSYQYDQKPEYYVLGGLVFTPLTSNYLISLKKPSNKLIAKIAEFKSEKIDEVVLLSQVLADETTVGYQNMWSLEVNKVNGKEIKNFDEFISVLENQKTGYVTLTVNDDVPIVLDVEKAKKATSRVMNIYGIPANKSVNK